MIAMTEADGFALAMIAILMLSLGTVLGILISILRNGAKRDHEVEDLIDEVSRDEKRSDTAPAGNAGHPSRMPWEKDGDWWRKG